MLVDAVEDTEARQKSMGILESFVGLGFAAGPALGAWLEEAPL